MNNSDLISGGDYLIFFAYALLCFYILKMAVFKKMDKKTKRLFGVFFILKSLCALLMTALVVYYWQTSDNISYFSESGNFIRLIKTDIANIKYFFLPVENYNDKIRLDTDMEGAVNSIGIESNFMVTRIATLLYPLSLGRFLMMNFLFSLLAIVGQFKFYLVLSKRYPHIKKNIAVAVLLMPSVLLYSSYLNKETPCMAFAGFAFYNFYQAYHNKKRIAYLFLLVNLFLIGVLKIYILAAFFSAILTVCIIKLILYFWKGSVISKFFITASLGILLWVFLSNLSYFDPYIVDFADKSNTFQQQYNSMESTSAFEFGEIETSFSGLLQKAPLGVYTAYFRPHLWEVNKPIILFSALESALVLILTFWAVVIRIKYIRPLLKSDLLANISFYYVLIFGMIVGLTTFNFGTLIRYKIPAVPFLMLFVFLLLHYRPEKKKIITGEIIQS